MYSHGSSARVGIGGGGGKRGHGGRDYRPPSNKRRDPNTTPPPLKQCSTLLQFHIPEYQTPAPANGRRIHQSFGGGGSDANTNNNGGQKRIQKLEKDIRSQCLCHLIIPGRKQCGPVAIQNRAILFEIHNNSIIINK